MSEPDLVHLARIGSTPWGTLGRLALPDGFACATMEPRWEYNARGKSCIPAGLYGLERRNSPIVDKTTGGLFHSGWEVTGIQGRDLIMIHPGNWANDSNGCILVGRTFIVMNGTPAVSASRATFIDLMRRLDARNDWRIDIQWGNPERA